MTPILFVRTRRGISGGQIKVWDYFAHCLDHPQLDPYVFIPEGTTCHKNSPWNRLPPERLVRSLDIERFPALFLAGDDWKVLPQDAVNTLIINLIQHVRHGDLSDPRFGFLGRPAVRICVSSQVRDAIAPHAAGEVYVIDNGVSLDLFRRGQKQEQSVLIWGRKNKLLGKRIRTALHKRGVAVQLLMKPLPREEFAQLLSVTDILVALPHQEEGFYLPALEAMASGCAVVCSDAVGNRDFCLDHETCLMPRFNDVGEHLSMIGQLLVQPELREHIRLRGLEMASAYSLEHEREEFYRVLEEHVLS